MNHIDWTVIVTTVVTVIAVFFSASRTEKSFEDRFNDLVGRLEKLQQYLVQMTGNLEGRLGLPVNHLGARDIGSLNARSTSPITLTEKGQKLATDYNVQAFVDKYAERILIPDDANRLEIQEACFNFAFSFKQYATRDEVDAISDAIFEDGGNAGETLVIYGILFRDKLFGKRDLAVPQSSEAVTA